MRRVAESVFDFERELGLWLDGQGVGRCRTLRVSVVADAITLVF